MRIEISDGEVCTLSSHECEVGLDRIIGALWNLGVDSVVSFRDEVNCMHVIEFPYKALLRPVDAPMNMDWTDACV